MFFRSESESESLAVSLGYHRIFGNHCSGNRDHGDASEPVEADGDAAEIL
jgi:hypothetical protein